MEPTRTLVMPVLDPKYRLGKYQGASLRGSSAPILQRVLYRFHRAGVDITDRAACWPWPGALSDPGGYPRMASDPLGENYVHRIMYRECVGPIPDGHEVDHLCHSRDSSCVDGPACLHRRCCNPAHLEPVTHAENRRRARTDERGLPCANGPHEFAPRRTQRGCRTCYTAYLWAYKRGFRGTYADLWGTTWGADWQSARRAS